MRIYIAGAGAMGCRFGYQLTQSGEDVILLDKWPDHIEAIQENGLVVTGDKEDTVSIPIMQPEEATDPADLIILFTKAMQLSDMLSSIQPIIGDETRVLCLLNGLGHLERIEQYVQKKHILMGVTVWTAQLNGPGQVHLSGTGAINLQSVDAAGDAIGQEVVDVLNKAELNATYDRDVWPSIWRKVCVNGTMNGTCALMDANIGEVFAHDAGLRIVRQLIHEFVTVAAAEGITIDKEEMYQYVIDVSQKVGTHYPSMHQDLIQQHRLTEIDFINGAVAKIGQKHGLDTPYCQMLTDLIHLKEGILKV